MPTSIIGTYLPITTLRYILCPYSHTITGCLETVMNNEDPFSGKRK